MLLPPRSPFDRRLFYEPLTEQNNNNKARCYSLENVLLTVFFSVSFAPHTSDCPPAASQTHGEGFLLWKSEREKVGRRVTAIFVFHCCFVFLLLWDATFPQLIFHPVSRRFKKSQPPLFHLFLFISLFFFALLLRKQTYVSSPRGHRDKIPSWSGDCVKIA